MMLFIYIHTIEKEWERCKKGKADVWKKFVLKKGFEVFFRALM